MRTGKASAAANKLRTSARAMGSYTAGLRPYFDKLRPYANELRRHAVTAVDAAWSWLHRGIVQVARVSPRTAKRLEGIETWVCRSERRKLGTAAFAVVLVLGGGFAAIFPEMAGRYGRVIFTSNRVVPLPDETRRAAGEKAKQLAAALDMRLDKKLAGEAWTSAQILVALRENDPSSSFSSRPRARTEGGRCSRARSRESSPRATGPQPRFSRCTGNRLSNPTASRRSGSPPRCNAARTG